MRRRLILIAATWAAVVGLVAGSAQAQAPTPPGGQFSLVGVVMLEGGRELAWIQEPTFTNNKVVTVHLGDSVGPYRVTKILTHQVELTGPGGTVSVPLAGAPGGVSVASSAGTVPRPAGELQPTQALQKTPPAILIDRGDPRRNWPLPASGIPAGTSPAWQPQASQPRAASAQDVAAAQAAQKAALELPPGPPAVSQRTPAILINRGDPQRDFPTWKMFNGK